MTNDIKLTNGIKLNYIRYDLPSTSNDDGLTMMDQKLVLDALYELRRARIKFPKPTASGLALMEEVGELAEAVLKNAAGKWPASRIREEGLQVIAMVLRIVNEGDPSITSAGYEELEIKYNPGPDSP